MARGVFCHWLLCCLCVIGLICSFISSPWTSFDILSKKNPNHERIIATNSSHFTENQPTTTSPTAIDKLHFSPHQYCLELKNGTEVCYQFKAELSGASSGNEYSSDYYLQANGIQGGGWCVSNGRAKPSRRWLAWQRTVGIHAVCVILNNFTAYSFLGGLIAMFINVILWTILLCAWSRYRTCFVISQTIRFFSIFGCTLLLCSVYIWLSYVRSFVHIESVASTATLVSPQYHDIGSILLWTAVFFCVLQSYTVLWTIQLQKEHSAIQIDQIRYQRLNHVPTKSDTDCKPLACPVSHLV